MSLEDRTGTPSTDTTELRLGRRHDCTRARRPTLAPFVVALALAALCCGTDASAEGPAPPSPLDGPGVPALNRSQTKKVEKAWNKLAAGRAAEAAKVANKVTDTPAGRLVLLQVDLARNGNAPVKELASLCASNPSYAAAWATLTAALEAGGDEAATLRAARKVAELWPDSTWGRRAASLEQRWVDERVASARELLEEGNAAAALELVDVALALDPASARGLMTKAKALAELDRHDEAKAVLYPIAHAPAARMLMAEMAEEDGNLQEAMQHYTAVPETTPGRDQALRRVKLEWRRQNLPAHVQAALASDDLNRAELAVVLVGLVPEASAIGGGQVPVLSDIVDLPSQREVVTSVRLGLLAVDQLQHQFDPDRPADPAEARSAVNRLCVLLDLQPPPWCTETSSAGESCARLEAPISGRALADVILQATQLEGP